MNNAQRSVLGSLGGTIFLLGLVLAFVWNPFNLPVFFAGLAFASLFGSLSTGKRGSITGGLNGFIWFITLALFFLTQQWIVFIIALIISGALSSMLSTLPRTNNQLVYNQPPQQPYYQPLAQQEQPSVQREQLSETSYYQQYEQGYQSTSSATYQEINHQPLYRVQDYEQPQAQYPEQPLPPQQ